MNPTLYLKVENRNSKFKNRKVKFGATYPKSKIGALLIFVLLIYSNLYSQPDPLSSPFRVGAALSTPFNAGVHRLTLKECVDKAITNNAEAQRSNLQAEISAVTLKQSKANMLPDLFANLGHGLNQGRSIDPFTNSYINRSLAFGNYSLSSGILLYNGSQIKNTIKQNQLSYEADKLDAAQTKENITLNVILAYVQILNNEDLLQQSKNQAEVTRKQVERLAILDKAGAIAPAQYYDLKGQLANDELAIINNQNALDGAKLTLAQLMNVPFNRSITVENIPVDTADTKYAATPASLYDMAANKLPMVRASELRKESAAKSLQIARGSSYPVISLSGSLNTNYSNAANREVFLNAIEVASGDFVTFNGNKVPVITQRQNYASEKINYPDQFKNNYGTSLFINVRVPILNGFRAKNRMAIAKIDIKNADITAQAVKTQLNQQIEQAYFNLDAASERMQTLERQVADFAESFRTTEVRFNAGVVTQVDYLIAKNNADRSGSNLIIAKYDYLFRAKILDYYQGKLSL
jgi:outer membrane protein